MRRGRLLMLVLLCMLCTVTARAADPARQAVELTIHGAIGPASADYVHRGIESARTRGAAVVILRLDTPGGLDSAMRDIIRDILHSPVPVVGYVAPGGARAASAGTYILYACHVAAMAPGTNLGAATPVEIGGLGGPEPAPSPPAGKSPAGSGNHADVMAAKRVNDAAAYLRSLAQLRGRNTEWAERAVREAASLPAEEAVKLHVVDLLAQDEQDLLKKLQGRHVNIAGAERVLDTRDLSVVPYLPDWRNRLLATITDPNVAYILLLIGIYGLFFEFVNPGYVLPGVTGGISLLLALYAFQILPVSYAGLGLVALGIAFMVAEAFVPSFGALGIGGVVAFVAGSILLYDQSASGYAVSLPLIIGLAVVSAGFFLFIVGAAIKARRRPVVSGMEELLQATGEALDDFNGVGLIHVHGETWQARSTEPVARGERVRVTALDGLVLQVRRLSGEEK